MWSDSGILLYRGGTDLVDRGLSAVRHVVWMAAGDFDNDGLADLCVVTTEGVLLFRNDRSAGFRQQTLAAVGNSFRRAIWIDYDHDRDLDRILLGTRSLFLRNDGSAGWEDRTRDFPFIAAAATDASVLRSAPDDVKAFDLLVSYEGHGTVLYRDRLNGRYEATSAPQIPVTDEFRGAAGLPDYAVQAAADFNGDGSADVIGVTAGGTVQLALNETKRAGGWLTISLEGVKSLKIPVGAEVEVKAGTFYQ